MTLRPTVAVCTTAVAVLGISAAHQLLTAAPRTMEQRMATPASHCGQIAQSAHTAPLWPAQASEVLARCQAFPPPMPGNLGWEILLHLGSR
jgi:hypothetical protein